VFLAAYAAAALGATNLIVAYGGVFPWQTFAVIFTVPCLLFAAVVLGARLVARRVHPLAGMLAFAALWTTWDFAASFGPDGTAASPAYSQVGMPLLIQGASVFGLWVITFLLGFVASGLALALRTRTVWPAALAAGVFALNAGYGALVIRDTGEKERVGLIADDTIAGKAFARDRKNALDVIGGYAQAARTLDAPLIVMPEHVAILDDTWREDASKLLQDVADKKNATLVIGLDDRTGNARRNIAWVFQPHAVQPLTYVKRRLVPGLESRFAPGAGPLALPNDRLVEICKDMDFQAMLRVDANATRPRLAVVPAWDFETDAFPHARMAILRSVENGFAMARASRNGLLTLNDAYGRVTSRRASGDARGFVTLTGAVALGGGGPTLYGRIGDTFAVAAAALSAALLLLALLRSRMIGSGP
jgi:apolipoprotein N-acyltransferase